MTPRRSSYLKRRKPLQKSTSFSKRGGKPKPTNPARRKKAFARAYGSDERVAFVKSRGCVVRSGGCEGPIQNAHTENGGMSRKADARTVVGMCNGHHCELHWIGVVSFQKKYRLMLVVEAEICEAAWLSSREGEAA